MNKNLLLVLCSIFIALSFVLIGCSNSVGNNSDYNVSSPEIPSANPIVNKGPVKSLPKVQAQEDLSFVKEELNKRIDSLSNRLSKSTEEINKSVEDVKGIIENTKEDIIKNTKGDIGLFRWMAIISLVATIIMIILVAWLWRRCEKLSECIRNIGNSLEGLERTVMWYSPTSQHTKSSSTVRYVEKNAFDDLYAKVRELQDEVQNRSIAGYNTQCSQTKNIPQIASQKGYFALPSKGPDDRGYFRQIYDKRDSDVRFEAEIKDNCATFRPVDKIETDNTFFSSDVVDVAVDIDDSACTRKDVKHVDVVSPGKAELKNDRWYITKKAELKLKK